MSVKLSHQDSLSGLAIYAKPLPLVNDPWADDAIPLGEVGDTAYYESDTIVAPAQRYLVFEQVDAGDAPTSTDAPAIGTITVNVPGDGDTLVNHDTGGTDALRFRDSGGNGIAGTVRAYLSSEYGAGAATRGLARTGADGRWLTPMMLASGMAYTLVFHAPRYPTAVVEVTIP